MGMGSIISDHKFFIIHPFQYVLFSILVASGSPYELSLSTVKMADLEAVLADVSYLMAMEKSKSTPAARASKKIVLPDPSFIQTITANFLKRKNLAKYGLTYSHDLMSSRPLSRSMVHSSSFFRF
ncbi:hypothetical protein TNIN_387891 [Trichonephila inaurata madagascariensis]|uniref:Uncharacterized protein n=1 Tax=Trichonephila inaurata madagascariensis TaxID=2747483 RepID=A0A8X6ITK4_9ARAC|nr:hypothetical protein TNIN_387891 [Trichonephila inaurata madagascariensis]